MADKGYDIVRIHHVLEGKHGCHPIIPLRDMNWDKAKFLDKHGHPFCPSNDGPRTWIWKGSDYKRKRSKWYCPQKARDRSLPPLEGCTRGCASSCYLNWADDPRKHSLIPRGTKKFETLYNKRGSVEREFSRLKGQYLLDTLRVQGLAKVKLHVDLAIFVRLLTVLVNGPPQ